MSHPWAGMFGARGPPLHPQLIPGKRTLGFAIQWRGKAARCKGTEKDVVKEMERVKEDVRHRRVVPDLLPTDTKEMESEPGEADALVDAPVDAGSPIRLKTEEDVALQATAQETVRTTTITERRGIATLVPRTNYGPSPCEINVPRHRFSDS